MVGVRVRRARFVALGALSAGVCATIVACVGDSPTTSPTDTDSGTLDGSPSNTTDGTVSSADSGTDGGSQGGGDAGDAGPPPAAKGDVLWAKTWAVTNADTSANAVTVDAAGNTYVAGTYAGSNVSFDGKALPNAAGVDIFVAKIDPAGVLVWVKAFGGTGFDNVHGIAVGTNQDLYISGEFLSPTILFNNTLTEAGGPNTGYVAKIATDTGIAAWGYAFTSTGSGSGGVVCPSVAISGTIAAVACNFNGPTLAFTGGSVANHENTSPNAGDGAVIGLDVSGATPTLKWSNAFGTTGPVTASDNVSAVVANGPNDFAVSGTSHGAIGSALSDNMGSVSLPHIGAAAVNNAFFVRLKAGTGGAELGSKAYGDTVLETDAGVKGASVAMDPTGTLAYLGGSIRIRGDVGTGSVLSSGTDDAFCAQINVADQSTKWLKQAGSNAGSTGNANLTEEQTTSIAVDRWSQVICVGTTATSGAKVDGTAIASPNDTSSGAEGVFIGKFNSSAKLLWAKGLASVQVNSGDYVGFGALSTAVAPNGEVRVATAWHGKFSFDGGASTIQADDGGYNQAMLILALSP